MQPVLRRPQPAAPSPIVETDKTFTRVAGGIATMHGVRPCDGPSGADQQFDVTYVQASHVHQLHTCGWDFMRSRVNTSLRVDIIKNPSPGLLFKQHMDLQGFHLKPLIERLKSVDLSGRCDLPSYGLLGRSQVTSL